MPIYDGNEAAQEHLLEVTKACAVAAARAPTLSGSLDLKMEIITGDDLLPLIDVMETFGQAAEMLHMDALTYRKLLESGNPPPVLLLGADLTRAVGWDCGACGFSTCKEFAKYVRTDKGRGGVAMGPSCLWKVMDFGVAADHACACAASHRVEARIQFTMGAICTLLGHLKGCSCGLGLPLGPAGSNHWFDRLSMAGVRGHEALSRALTVGAPNLRMAFAGSGNPIIKTKQSWWENATFLKIEEDPEGAAKAGELRQAVMQKIKKYTIK